MHCQAIGWQEISILSRWHGPIQDQSLRRLLDMGAPCLKAVRTVTLPGHPRLYTTPAFVFASNIHSSISMATTVVIPSKIGLSHPDFPFKKIRSLAINGSSTRVNYAYQDKVKYYLSDLSLPCLRSFALKYANKIIQYPFAAESVADVLGTCSQSLRSLTLERVLIRASSLIDILPVVPGLTCLEIRDPVIGSFIPYCPVSQTLGTYIETDPAFLPDLEAVEFIWQREDTGRKLEMVPMEMVETRRAYGKL
ncbi:hypothetical protein ARMSODRAFT_1091096 [Armillaria solidipes]|uniref:Uncharacterized protein n=1 Tax=Armillaria solidipes TaxID=1076256 RepID=A0A2H3AIE8_9AGAR|nr:hypothetical protein ARMSODRAFT_1091096 [Armillaria solidipes]